MIRDVVRADARTMVTDSTAQGGRSARGGSPSVNQRSMATGTAAPRRAARRAGSRSRTGRRRNSRPRRAGVRVREPGLRDPRERVTRRRRHPEVDHLDHSVLAGHQALRLHVPVDQPGGEHRTRLGADERRPRRGRRVMLVEQHPDRIAGSGSITRNRSPKSLTAGTPAWRSRAMIRASRWNRRRTSRPRPGRPRCAVAAGRPGLAGRGPGLHAMAAGPSCRRRGSVSGR